MHAILQPLVDALFAILEFVHNNLGLSWGWSIVILTVIVRVILLPLTFKQFRSMRAMQHLQPQIKELQEKFKHDRQLLNQKIMEFYRENKVNPFSSCLPLILQMPVFIALFYMLQAETKQAGAFSTDNHWLWMRDWGDGPSWIARDITQFDLPLLFLYVASQFVTSLQMGTRDRMQRAMMLAMPIGIGIFMYVGRWPAGLFIYWFTSNLWTILQQFIIMKTVPVPQPAVPVPEPTPATGGASGRVKQPKQPTKRRKTKAKGRKS